MHTHMHTCTYTRSHTHTHTHTPVSLLLTHTGGLDITRITLGQSDHTKYWHLATQYGDAGSKTV